MNAPIGSKMPSLLPGTADYPRNSWYVAAFSHEVTADALLARTLCDLPLVLYRDANGEPIILFDRCPHRALPLSKGKLLEDGQIRCNYHGIQFRGDGSCGLIPSQSNIPSTMRVRSFPVIERWKWIWFWPGDPEKADPDLIPDHKLLRLEDPAFESTPAFVIHWKANYLLPLENGPDQTHVGYLHEGKVDLENSDTVSGRVELEGRFIKTIREYEDLGWPFDEWLGYNIAPGAPRLRYSVTAQCPPNVGLILVSLAPCDDPERWETFCGPFAVTPEYHNSCWEFFASATDYKRSGEATQKTIDIAREIQNEDIEALEEIQRCIDTNPAFAAARFVEIRSDEQYIRARRETERMIVAERNEGAG